MPQFENVVIVKAANVYFEGQVTSRTIKFEDGTSKTLGIMLPGEYIFNTGDKELMEILSGELEVLLPGDEWKFIQGGESFEVAANAKFQIKVKSVTDYCCHFIK